MRTHAMSTGSSSASGVGEMEEVDAAVASRGSDAGGGGESVVITEEKEGGEGAVGGGELGEGGTVDQLFEVRTLKDQLEVEAEVELVQRELILVTVEFEQKVKKKLILFQGIIQDIQRRLPHYLSDYTDGLNLKTAAATLFLSFACLTPCVAFGGLTANLTNGAIGVVETIVGTAASGIAYAIFAGQPLTLLGPTGLIVVFIGLLNKACMQLSLPFLPTYSWVGIWSAVFLIGLAATEACDLVRLFTRFTDDTFSALISFQFISEAMKSITALFKAATVSTEGALLGLVTAIGTYTGITVLSQLRNSRYFVKPIRDVISDFGPPLTIIAMSCVPLLLFPHVSLPSLYVPSSIGTTTGRPWLVQVGSLPLWGIVGAAIPAALLSLLIFLDQNITTRLVCGPQYPLRKGQGYHLDLAVLGVIMGVCSLFGLPWMTASTVPSLSHIRSLAITKKLRMMNPGSGPSYVEYIEGVQETRVTGIAIHVCVGASLLLLSLLRLIPMPVTYGVFLYMGISSLSGNQFIERLKLMWCDPEMYPQWDFIKSVPKSTLHIFTCVQLSCLAALWTLKHSKCGILFPVLIVALLPIRNWIVPRIVPLEHLRVLDAH
uniref:SLC4-like OH(H) transporter protein n=1 Tax=Chara australis TaxID=31298 RepID=A0A7S6GHY6_9VIRI|nr:SLC4-like OH(H) transporter protein [Chara australis]